MSRRSTSIASAAAFAVLIGAAAVPATATTSEGPPTLSPGEIDASVRILDPPVRMLDPQVRSLRQESVEGPTTTVTISSDVLFEFNSAELTDAARGVVDETGTQLAGTPGAVTVVGHTDSVGTQEYNQTLSEDRARAVAEQLRASVGDRQVDTAGRSFLEPVAPNEMNGQDNPAGRALNRRVVITVQAPA